VLYIGNMKAPLLVLLLAFIYLSSKPLLAQGQRVYTDGRYTDPVCAGVLKMIEEKPKEVLFGISVGSDGTVIFEMDNREWFNKIFRPGMSVTADIVSKDRYACNAKALSQSLFKGYVMKPVTQAEFAGRTVQQMGNAIAIRIGKLPPALMNKEVEANLVILIGDEVCYYTNFVDIDRAAWDILPMGLYTDTLLNQTSRFDTAIANRFIYDHKVQVVVSFARNKDTYEGNDVKRVYDSLGLQNCTIKKCAIRAYSSVEGTEAANKQLMKGRANTMAGVLKRLQPGLNRISVLTAENWLDFYREIRNTPFADLGEMTREEAKVKLLDPVIREGLEPILGKERKCILTLYYAQKSGLEKVTNKLVVDSFQHALGAKKIGLARLIQKEIFERVSDHKLPDLYLDQLEIPREKDNLELLSDRIIYKYWLEESDEKDALAAFQEVKALDPGNGKVNYNICALSIFEWHFYSDSVDAPGLRAAIDSLGGEGIDPSLVKRMLVNYHILLSFDLLNKFKYDEKDKAVQFIKENYEALTLSDEDRFSLAKYFSFYSQQDWAKELIGKRIDQLDVSEDLLFYYVNLGFFSPSDYEDEAFGKALLNASMLNRVRFCHFFNSINKGGASMQLLEAPVFRQLYCEDCVQAGL
jgi:hypothetical protein